MFGGVWHEEGSEEACCVGEVNRIPGGGAFESVTRHEKLRLSRLDEGRAWPFGHQLVSAPEGITREERLAIMTICGNCTEEEAQRYVDSKEYRESMREWMKKE